MKIEDIESMAAQLLHVSSHFDEKYRTDLSRMIQRTREAYMPIERGNATPNQMMEFSESIREIESEFESLISAYNYMFPK